MNKKKEVEQLQEETVPVEAKKEQPAEEVAEAVKETTEETPSKEETVEEVVEKKPTEEAIEEAAEEEKAADAPNAEALKEEAPAEEATKEVVEEAEAAPEEKKVEGGEKEALKKDISETKEELQVIKEVRDELVTLYAHNKDLEVSRENLSKETETFKAENKILKEQLSRYVEAEKEIAGKKRLERLEKLSTKFKELGQEKTIEQLSEKDEDTLQEFEKIVDAAIEKSGETREMPEATVPSQSIGAVPVSEITASEGVVEQLAEPKSETENDFFTRMTRSMAGTQSANSRNGKVLEL